ncbi:hypothetical protein BH09DEP1_BH09DEP1_1190 [soil metagenome]
MDNNYLHGIFLLAAMANLLQAMQLPKPKSSPRIERIQGSPRTEPSPRKNPNQVISLACQAVRCLVHESDFLTNQEKLDLIVPGTRACLKEVLLREFIKPHIFPLTIVESQNKESVHHNGVCGLDFIDTTNEIVSGACDGKVVFCDRKSLAAGTSYEFDDLSVSALSASVSLPLSIFLGSARGIVYQMAYDSKKVEHYFKAHDQTINKICVGDSLLATCSNDRTVKLWNKNSATLWAHFEGYKQAIRCLELLEDDNVLISGCSEGKIKAWNIENKTLITQMSYLELPRIWGLGIMKNKKQMAIGLNSGRISLVDATTFKEICQWYGHNVTICGLSCDPDERYFATASWDANARLWDPRMRICAATFAGHRDWVQQVKCIGDEVVTGSRDNTLKLWDIRMIKEMDNAKFPIVTVLASRLKNYKSFKEPLERDALLAELLTKTD